MIPPLRGPACENRTQENAGPLRSERQLFPFPHWVEEIGACGGHPLRRLLLGEKAGFRKPALQTPESDTCNCVESKMLP